VVVVVVVFVGLPFVDETSLHEHVVSLVFWI
jgi:hypothetical protein